MNWRSRRKQLKKLKNSDKDRTLEVIDEISRKNKESSKLKLKFRKIDRTLDKAELFCKKTDGAKYDFNHFGLAWKFIEKIHNYEIILDETIDDQVELEVLIDKLNRERL